MSWGDAPGKAILLGEHFVVHGAPALAVPVRGRRTRIRLERSLTPAAWQVPPGTETSARAMVDRLGEDPDALWLHAETDLPIGAGLGASASAAVALVRALGHRDPARVRELAHDLERLAHGSPSGIDDAVVTWEAPIFFVAGEPPVRLAEPGELPLRIAVSSGRTATREAVAQVGAFAEREPARFRRLVERACAIAEEGRAAFETAAWPRLGALMDENHGLLREIGVSTPRLDALVEAARAAGALGAKLTGGGGGGAIVLLVEPERAAAIDAVLTGLGAVEVFPA